VASRAWALAKPWISSSMITQSSEWSSVSTKPSSDTIIV
jgi:hypothetical protein